MLGQPLPLRVPFSLTPNPDQSHLPLALFSIMKGKSLTITDPRSRTSLQGRALLLSLTTPESDFQEGL